MDLNLSTQTQNYTIILAHMYTNTLCITLAHYLPSQQVTSTQIHKFKTLQVHKEKSKQLHRYTIIQVHKFRRTQVNNNTSPQLHKLTSSQIY